MTSPRIEIDLDAIEDNARELVGRVAARGGTVTGITKALRGWPPLGHALVRAGVSAVGDSRVEHLERLRAGGVRGPFLLVRSPRPSEVDRVVRAADASCNSELEVVTALAGAARRHGRTHDVILMVELGDLREGLMPRDVVAAAEHCRDLDGIELVGVGANLACRHGIVPDDRNMGELSAIADAVDARLESPLRIVSGGNSATLGWWQTTHSTGRIDDLRLGESILLGRDPVTDTPIPGLHLDPLRVVAEIIESKRKPPQAWGTPARSPFAAPRPPQPSSLRLATHPDDTDDLPWQSLVALGHQDLDPTSLVPPPGVRIVGASSDHLVIRSRRRWAPGSEIELRPGYAALATADSSTEITELGALDDQPAAVSFAVGVAASARTR